MTQANRNKPEAWIASDFLNIQPKSHAHTFDRNIRLARIIITENGDCLLDDGHHNIPALLSTASSGSCEWTPQQPRQLNHGETIRILAYSYNIFKTKDGICQFVLASDLWEQTTEGLDGGSEHSVDVHSLEAVRNCLQHCLLTMTDTDSGTGFLHQSNSQNLSRIASLANQSNSQNLTNQRDSQNLTNQRDSQNLTNQSDSQNLSILAKLANQSNSQNLTNQRDSQNLTNQRDSQNSSSLAKLTSQADDSSRILQHQLQQQYKSMERGTEWMKPASFTSGDSSENMLSVTSSTLRPTTHMPVAHLNATSACTEIVPQSSRKIINIVLQDSRCQDENIQPKDQEFELSHQSDCDNLRADGSLGDKIVPKPHQNKKTDTLAVAEESISPTKLLELMAQETIPDSSEKCGKEKVNHPGTNGSKQPQDSQKWPSFLGVEPQLLTPTLQDLFVPSDQMKALEQLPGWMSSNDSSVASFPSHEFLRVSSSATDNSPGSESLFSQPTMKDDRKRSGRLLGSCPVSSKSTDSFTKEASSEHLQKTRKDSVQNLKMDATKFCDGHNSNDSQADKYNSSSLFSDAEHEVSSLVGSLDSGFKHDDERIQHQQANKLEGSESNIVIQKGIILKSHKGNVSRQSDGIVIQKDDERISRQSQDAISQISVANIDNGAYMKSLKRQSGNRRSAENHNSSAVPESSSGTLCNKRSSRMCKITAEKQTSGYPRVNQEVMSRVINLSSSSSSDDIYMIAGHDIFSSSENMVSLTEPEAIISSGDSENLISSTDSKNVMSSTDSKNVRSSTDSKNVRMSSDSKNVRSSTDSKNVRSTDSKNIRSADSKNGRSPTDSKNIKLSTDSKNIRSSTDSKNIKSSTDPKNVMSSTDSKNIRSTDSKNVRSSTDSKNVRLSTDSEILLLSADSKNIMPSTDSKNLILSADSKNIMPSTDSKKLISSTDSQNPVTSTNSESVMLTDSKMVTTHDTCLPSTDTKSITHIQHPPSSSHRPAGLDTVSKHHRTKDKKETDKCLSKAAALTSSVPLTSTCINISSLKATPDAAYLVQHFKVTSGCQKAARPSSLHRQQLGSDNQANSVVKCSSSGSNSNSSPSGLNSGGKRLKSAASDPACHLVMENAKSAVGGGKETKPNEPRPIQKSQLQKTLAPVDSSQKTLARVDNSQKTLAPVDSSQKALAPVASSQKALDPVDSSQKSHVCQYSKEETCGGKSLSNTSSQCAVESPVLQPRIMLIDALKSNKIVPDNKKDYEQGIKRDYEQGNKRAYERGKVKYGSRSNKRQKCDNRSRSNLRRKQFTISITEVGRYDMTVQQIKPLRQSTDRTRRRSASRKTGPSEDVGSTTCFMKIRTHEAEPFNGMGGQGKPAHSMSSVKGDSGDTSDHLKVEGTNTKKAVATRDSQPLRASEDKETESSRALQASSLFKSGASDWRNIGPVLDSSGQCSDESNNIWSVQCPATLAPVAALGSSCELENTSKFPAATPESQGFVFCLQDESSSGPVGLSTAWTESFESSCIHEDDAIGSSGGFMPELTDSPDLDSPWNARFDQSVASVIHYVCHGKLL